MRRAEDSFRTQPIIMAVLAVHGLDIDALPWEQCDSAAGEEVSIDATHTMPSVHLHSEGSVNIRWWRGIEGTVAFTMESDGYAIVTMERRETPETMLAAMTGRRLDAIVDMPGAEGMYVMEAVNSRAFVGDPMDTRIAVKPIGTDVEEV